MPTKTHRLRVVRLALLSVLAWLGTAAWAPSASATSGLFDNNCSGCHGPSSGVAPYPTNTCAGCHAHGVHSSSAKSDINVTATPDSTTYNPGDPMTVSVTGSYRSGWVRAQMWGLNCSAGGTCNQGNALVSESLYTSGNTVTFPGPVILNATAPTTPGTYTWYAGWYGNEFDSGSAAFGLYIPDTTNSGHGNELVAFTFTVNQVTPPETICDDGIDNNNGLTDCADPDCDAFVGMATSCGVGACEASGNLVCQTPDQVDTCTPGAPEAEGPFNDPSCSDEIDNDCDGLTDADDPDCAAPEEICDDGIDNNGNGLTDCEDPQCDNFVYGTTSCGVGACAATGQEICQTPNIVDTCEPGTPGAEGPFGDPTCSDGIDNDCNGVTDADDPACAAPAEICDNQIDDNLNGLTDCEDPQCEDVTYGACDTGNPGVCAAGTLTCDGSAVGPVCVQDQTAGTEGPFGDATCGDGLDNDCNGLTDDLDPNCQLGAEICDNDVDDNGNGLIDCADVDFCEGHIGQTGDCSTGLPGICSAGTTSCSGGQEFCDQDVQAGTEGPFDSPTCSDGLDNDCDGLTDADDPDCTAPLEVCDNNVDDNGNGLVDCEDPQCADATFGACDTGNQGICAAGTLTCDGSQPGPVCTADQTAQPEGPAGSPSCSDGLDNDCDGLTDAEDPDCQVPPVEICDNQIDDNGNGLTDCEDPECDQVTFGACDTGEPGICAAGTLTCDGTAVGPVCMQNQEPVVEGPYTSMTCTDGVDNDCDGLTDADDPDCAMPVGGDVYLSSLQAPKKLQVKKGQVLKKTVTARGDGTQLKQDATVTLSAAASRGIGVVIKRDSITEQVKPGRPETKFQFSVFVSCKGKGSGTVDWTAEIDAPANDDPTNDTREASTQVTCSDDHGHDDHGHDDHGHDDHGHDDGKEDRGDH